MMKRVLVVGSNGQLARAFAECRAEFPGLSIGFISRPEIDLRQIEAACSKLEPIPFDVLVNATAYNDVDGAESDFETARAINAEAPERLAKLAAERGAAIVHFSTDYVFAGDAAPYREDDPTGPICRYGESKLEGEQRVAAANRRHLIFRTAWLFSPFARNFAKTIVELAGQRDELSVVDDQHGSPTSALDLGRATLAAVGDLGREDTRFGTYHLVGDEHASRFEFARAILEFEQEARRTRLRIERDRLSRLHVEGAAASRYETGLRPHAACIRHPRFGLPRRARRRHRPDIEAGQHLETGTLTRLLASGRRPPLRCCGRSPPAREASLGQDPAAPSPSALRCRSTGAAPRDPTRRGRRDPGGCRAPVRLPEATTVRSDERLAVGQAFGKRQAPPFIPGRVEREGAIARRARPARHRMRGGEW